MRTREKSVRGSIAIPPNCPDLSNLSVFIPLYRQQTAMSRAVNLPARLAPLNTFGDIFCKLADIVDIGFLQKSNSSSKLFIVRLLFLIIIKK